MGASVDEATAMFLSVGISVETPYEAVIIADEAAEKPKERDGDNGKGDGEEEQEELKEEAEEGVPVDGTNTLWNSDTEGARKAVVGLRAEMSTAAVVVLEKRRVLMSVDRELARRLWWGLTECRNEWSMINWWCGSAVVTIQGCV